MSKILTHELIEERLKDHGISMYDGDEKALDKLQEKYEFKMPNKKTKDSLGHDAAWAKWEKGYMDRTHKMKGTKFEKPITREENKKEMEMERGEFMYDKAKGQIRLRTDKSFRD